MAHWSDPETAVHPWCRQRMDAYDLCEPGVRAMLKEYPGAPIWPMSLDQAQAWYRRQQKHEAAEMRAKLGDTDV